MVFRQLRDCQYCWQSAFLSQVGNCREVHFLRRHQLTIHAFYGDHQPFWLHLATLTLLIAVNLFTVTASKMYFRPEGFRGVKA